MARIRYLKPDFFTDEDLCELPFEARILFEGLWCHADKAGRLEDRPKFLKAMIFPYDEVDIEKNLDLLSQRKLNGHPFIIRYQAHEQKLIQIVKWDKHQKPHHTEKESIFPPAPPLTEKGMGMGMGMGMEKQLEASTELRNRDLTVKKRLKSNKENFSNDNKEIEITTEAKKRYLNYVLLAEEEHEKLVDKFGKEKTDDLIYRLNNHIGSKGAKYKSHFFTLLNWERNDGNGRNFHKQITGKDGSLKAKPGKYEGIGTVLDTH
jgi:hypothetical protein